MSDSEATVVTAAASASAGGSTVAPDPNIHSPSDFERDYGGRDWRFYRNLVAACVTRAEPGPILDAGASILRRGFAVSAAGFGDYCACDSPRLLLGDSRPMEILLKIVFRLMPLGLLSASANCFAYKPLVGPVRRTFVAAVAP